MYASSRTCHHDAIGVWLEVGGEPRIPKSRNASEGCSASRFRLYWCLGMLILGLYGVYSLIMEDMMELIFRVFIVYGMHGMGCLGFRGSEVVRDRSHVGC